MNLIQLTKKLEALEQSNTAVNNSYVCYVDVGQDRDEVVERFRLDNNVQDGDIVHVVKFVSAKP